MKTLLCHRAAVVLGLSLCFLAGRAARGGITVESTSSFSSFTIVPSSGYLDYIGAPGTSAFSQAGANSQYDSSVDVSAAISGDVPVAGATISGTGAASLTTGAGSAGATGIIPGTTAGYDTSTGRASFNGEFEILGATGPVSVGFSATINGALDLMADSYGVSGQGETDFALSVNGTPLLFSDEILSIGPNQSQSDTIANTLTGSLILTPNTPYWFVGEADAETDVVNGNVAVVPEPSGFWLVAEGLALVGLICAARRRAMSMLLCAAMAGLAVTAHATYIGSDPPDVNTNSGGPGTRLKGGTVGTSLTEGNLREQFTIPAVKNSQGATLPLVLTYNSYNADGSKAQLDTGLGFGWTHTYNSLLFQQRGQMFRLGDDGRVTQFYMNYTGGGGTYSSDPGYYETLTVQGDGTFYLTNKCQCWWHYGSVPNTPFLVGGPVYRLLQMGDRNHNVTSMTYNSGGLLVDVTDPYGRTLQFTYNASNKLSSVSDPGGRVTQFQYDAQDREMTQIIDPLGNTIQYTYNAQYQMTRKEDEDGRLFMYMYKSQKPFMVTDGNGEPWFSLENPTDWAVNQTNVAYSLERQYLESTTTSTDGDGQSWQYTYDTNGYITQETDPEWNVSRYTYNPSTLTLSAATDRNGNTTTYQYDPEGNRTQTIDALAHVTTYTYDPSFNELTSITDANGFTTIYHYDADGNRISSMDPLGDTESWTYDAHGNLLTSTDGDGHTTSNTYDSFGDLISTTDPLGFTTRYQYDGDGNCIETIDPLGHLTRNQYDEDNREVATTDPLGNTTTTVYDGAGNVISTIEPNGRVTTHVYDDRGRLTSTTDALGGVTTTTYDADDNRISTIDPLGRATTHQYDADDRQIAVTDALGGVTSSVYDADGNVISRTDPDGITASFDYDALNRRTETVDPLGNSTTTAYDADGNNISTTDANGNTTRYDYDPLDREISTMDALGNTSRTAYDADGNVIEQIDANGHATYHYYDADNHPMETIDPLGHSSTTAYDADGNVILQIDANGNRTTYTYDDDNRQTETVDSLGDISTTVYDTDGNIVSQIDGDGNMTMSQYDSLNHQTEVVDPLGRASTTVYDADGEVISEIDANGNVTRYTYDALSREVSSTNAALGVTTMTYDADGNQLSLTDAEGNTTHYTYDALDRQIMVSHPASGESSQTYYDAVGNVIREVDVNGNVTEYMYDPLNRRVTVTDSAGALRNDTYDAVGNLIATEDGEGNTTTYTYDALNREITTTDAVGRPSYTSYDADGNVISTTDANGNLTTYFYDELNREIISEDSLLRTTNTTYDADGNIISRTDQDGHTTTYTYDALNRLATETYPDSPPRSITYTYDAVGDIILMTDQDAEVTQYSYDPLNLESGAQYQGGGLSDNFTYDASGRVITAQRGGWLVTYTYDGDGRVASTTENGLTITYTYDAAARTRTTTYPSGRAITHTYDDRDRLISITDGSTNPPIAIYTYDASDRLISRTYRNGVTTTYTYDADNRVLTIQHVLGASVIAADAYSYDGDSNRLYEQKLDEPGSSEIYTYDALDRLISYNVGMFSGGIIPSPTEQETWNLDGAGNWLSFISNGAPQNRVYGADNELTNINGQTLAYDGDGNLVQDGTYSYSYDEEHRLTNVMRLSDSADVGQYYYDALGREVMKITDPAGTPATNVYYYDDNRLIEERDGSGNLVATYTYDTDANVVQTMDRAGQTYYYHENAHRSPYVLTDTNGLAVERYSYDAYGYPKIMDGGYNPLLRNLWGTAHSAVSNAWLFINRQFNEETGLYTYFSRVYDSLQGRFLQRPTPGNDNDSNLYEYASDNPVSGTNSNGGRRTPSWWPHADYDEWGRRPIVDEWDRIIGWEHRDGNIELVPRERDFDTGIRLDGENCARNRNLYEIGFSVGDEFVPGYCVLKIECKGADGKTAVVTATVVGSLQVCAASEGAAKAPGIVFGVVAPKVNLILQQLREYRGVSATIQSIKFRDTVTVRKIADGCCGDARGFNDIPAVSLQVPESLFSGRPAKEGNPPELGFSLGEYFLRSDRPHGGLVFDSERDLPINKGIQPR